MSEILELAAVLQNLRDNLAVAKQDMDINLQLEINEIEIELQTVVTKNKDGKLAFGVLDFAKIEASGKYAKVATQKIKLKISPKSRNLETGKEESTRVSDKSKDDF